MERSRGKTTIKDVAEASGFSITTVSHALNGFSDVSEKTREKIIRISREMNYVANPAGRSLAGIPKKIIGMMVLGQILPEEPSALVYGLLSGISKVAEDNGYDFTLLTATEKRQKEISFDQLCRTKELSGVILYGMAVDHPYYKQVRESNIPCCLVDVDISAPHCGYIAVDNRQAFCELMEHVLRQGYTAPALICGTEHAQVSTMRTDGFKDAMKHAGLAIRPEWMVSGNFAMEDARTAALELLKKWPEIDALICESDEMAMGAWEAALQMGRKVPEDIGICGFDDIAVAKYYQGGITTIAQHPYEMGLRAGSMLVKLAEGEETAHWDKAPYSLERRKSTDRNGALSD